MVKLTYSVSSVRSKHRVGYQSRLNGFFRAAKNPLHIFSLRTITKIVVYIVLGSILALLLSPLSKSSVSAAASPNVSVSIASQIMLGQNISFTATFTNPGTQPGYGPFIDLIFPYVGTDGVYPFNSGFEADGLDFINATFINQPVTATVLQFTAANGGCVAHPYAVDNTNTPIQVCGTPGNKLVVLQMPFGSFVPGQPNVDITVNAHLSNLADVGQLLTIQSRGGYQFGLTAAADSSSDPSILVSFSNATTSATILTLTKTYNGPEGETATGSNFPHQYSVSVDIASGQTVTNLNLIDKLPNNNQYTSFGTASPGGSSLVTQPTTGAAQNTPNNNLTVHWPSVTGGSGSNDASMNFNFYVPQKDANNNDVINPNTGGCVNSVDDASATASWTPIDTRDSVASLTSDLTLNDYTLRDCSLVIQKSVAMATDTGSAGYTPGDVVQYTLNFQVSDYFVFNALNVNDILSDGQHFDATFTPTLTLHEHGSNTSGNFDAGNFSVTDHFTGGSPAVAPIDGSQTVAFNISNELTTRSFLNAGNVLGGCVPNGGGAIDCSGSSGTTGTITFRAKIQRTFTDNYLPQNANVDQGDVMHDNVTVQGTVLSTTTLVSTGNQVTDTSSAGLTIINGGLTSKQIYAVNGVIGSYTTPKIGPGDTITYRVTFTMPDSNVEDLIVTDYLPLPVFNSTELTTFLHATPNATAPPAGQAKFGPSDTFYGLSGIFPSLSTNAAANNFTLNYGSNQTLNDQATLIDILFTVTASNQPFADGLFLTNQAQSSEGTTNSGVETATQIVQIELTEPKLVITKGVVASDNIAAVFAPSTVGPVSFSAPGGGCSRISGTVNSTNLASAPINSDVSTVDAADLVTFAVTIENTGGGVHGAFDVTAKDVIPAGFVVPGGGLNLCVTDGTGAVLPYTAVNGGDTNPFVEHGIVLNDGVDGSLAKSDPSNGKNIAVITYDLQLATSVEPNSTYQNQATLTNYSNVEGGIDFTADDLTEKATATTTNVQISKSMTGTNIATTSGSNVVIGEIATYQVIVTVPEGTMNSSSLVDTLDAGLALVDVQSITASAGLSTSHAGGFSGVATDISVAPGGGTVTFPFDTITNSNTNNSVAETITLTYRVVVTNIAGNTRGGGRNNSALMQWATGNVSASAANVIIIEPTLQGSLTPAPTNADVGDTVTYTLVISHTGPSNSTAYDVTLQDILPAQLTYAGNLQNSAGVAPDGGSLTESGGTISATWASLAVGQTSTIKFDVTVASATLGGSITDTANIKWTSVSGPLSSPQSTYSAVATERTGNTGDPGGAANTYAANPNGVITVVPVALAKTIVATSEAHTGVLSSVERGAIGEIIRYRLETKVAEATGTNFQIADRLPTGMQFLNDNTAKIAFVSNESGITSTTVTTGTTGCSAGALNITGNETTISSVTPTCSLPDTTISTSSSSNSDTYVSGTDPRFKLGDIANNDSDTDSEYIVIEFNAFIRNDAGNQSATTLDNTYEVDNNGTTLIAQTTAGNSSRVRVVEPVLTVSKSVSTPPTDAGDTIVYSSTITNTDNTVNGADGFDIIFTDNLSASDLSFQSVVVSTPHSYVNNTSGNNVSITFDRLNKGESATVTTTATVLNTVSPSRQIPNSASLTYTSLPGANGTTSNATGSSTPGAPGTATGERIGSTGINDYNASASANANLAAPTMDKLPISPTAYAIGTTAHYYIKVTIPEGVINNLAVTDNLPVGLQYLSSQVITTVNSNLPVAYVGTVPSPTVTGGASNGAAVTFTFSSVTTTADNITNNNSFLIEVDATVLNVLTNQNGNTLNNTASGTYTNPNGAGTLSFSDGVPVGITIKEPILTLTKNAISFPAPLQGGSTVTYQLVLAHHAQSSADAYQVVITDPAVSKLTNVTNVSIGVTGPISVPSYSVVANTLTVPATGSITLPLGATVTITYDATVNAGSSETVTNSANAIWASTDPTNANTRSWQSPNGVYDLAESGASGLNDYKTQDTESLSTGDPSITKTLVATDNPSTSDVSNPVQLAIGETATFFLRVSMPEGNTGTLVLHDHLAANLKYVSDEVITTASASYSLFTQDFNGTVPAPACPSCIVDSVGADLTYTFSNVDTTTDGNGANNFFILKINAKVIDNPVNHGVIPPGQATFSNTASAQANPPTGNMVNTGTVNMIITEPNIQISKEFDSGVDPDQGTPNQIIGVSIVINNNGTGSAFDVSWEDNLNAITSGVFDYQSGTLSSLCTSGVPSAMSLDDSTDPVLTGTITELPAGESCTVTFLVKLDSSIDQSVTPTGTNQTRVLSSDTMPGTVSGERSQTNVTASDVITFLIPDLAINKDDSLTSVIPGQQPVYSLVVTNNGTATANGVTITETVPTHATYLPGSSTSGWTCTPDNSAGSTCTFDAGTLAPTDSTSAILFAVEIDNPLAQGTTSIINTSTVTDDGTNGLDPHLSDNTATDTDTVGNAVDLKITKMPAVTTIAYNQDLSYTLNYENVGTTTATGVVITETVPLHSTFNPGASTAGWSCTPDNTAGSTCTFDIASLANGSNGSVNFTVITDDYLTLFASIDNTVTIGDDGASGADVNPGDNTASSSTPVEFTNVFDPPSASKTVTPAGLPAIEWKMVWINGGNASAFEVRVIDPIPPGVSYIPGSFLCDARGVSTTVTCTYDAINNQVIWEGSMGPDLGATDEATALNEVVLTFKTTIHTGITDVINQAHAYWDDNNNGSVDDEIGAGQVAVVTNDPDTSPVLDPTPFHVPTLTNTGTDFTLNVLVGFILFMLVVMINNKQLHLNFTAPDFALPDLRLPEFHRTRNRTYRMRYRVGNRSSHHIGKGILRIRKS